jgi:DNA-binding response OmpR family regulator
MDAPPTPALVLIVEDDANAARMLAQLLREDGYQVEIALDGAVGIHRLGREPHPDVLIVDYRLPQADGLEVARYAREHLPSARILMVTSYPEVVENRLRAQNAAAILIPKPLAYEQLTRHLAAR